MPIKRLSLSGLMLSGFYLALVQSALAAEPSVTFLSGDAARAAIVDDAREPYFAQLQQLEIAA